MSDDLLLSPSQHDIMKALKEGKSMWHISGVPSSVCTQEGEVGGGGDCKTRNVLDVMALEDFLLIEKKKIGDPYCIYSLTDKGREAVVK